MSQQDTQNSQPSNSEQLDDDPSRVRRFFTGMMRWMQRPSPIISSITIGNKPRQVHIWHVLLTLGCLLLIVPSYYGPITPEMDWTGFCGNTVWDWLGLLLVPVALGIVAPAYARSHHSLHPRKWRPQTVNAVTGFAILLLAFLAAAYVLQWHGVGLWYPKDSPSGGGPGQCVKPTSALQYRKLWDWLTVLLLPLAVTAATIQFKRIHRRAIDNLATKETGAKESANTEPGANEPGANEPGANEPDSRYPAPD